MKGEEERGRLDLDLTRGSTARISNRRALSGSGGMLRSMREKGERSWRCGGGGEGRGMSVEVRVEEGRWRDEGRKRKDAGRLER